MVVESNHNNNHKEPLVVSSHSHGHGQLTGASNHSTASFSNPLVVAVATEIHQQLVITVCAHVHQQCQAQMGKPGAAGVQMIPVLSIVRKQMESVSQQVMNSVMNVPSKSAAAAHVDSESRLVSYKALLKDAKRIAAIVKRMVKLHPVLYFIEKPIILQILIDAIGELYESLLDQPKRFCQGAIKLWNTRDAHLRSLLEQAKFDKAHVLQRDAALPNFITHEYCVPLATEETQKELIRVLQRHKRKLFQQSMDENNAQEKRHKATESLQYLDRFLVKLRDSLNDKTVVEVVPAAAAATTTTSTSTSIDALEEQAAATTTTTTSTEDRSKPSYFDNSFSFLDASCRTNVMEDVSLHRSIVSFGDDVSVNSNTDTLNDNNNNNNNSNHQRRTTTTATAPAATATNNNAPPPAPPRALPTWAHCPISKQLMLDPITVHADCLHTLSKRAYKEWIELGNKTCPVCGTKLKSTSLAGEGIQTNRQLQQQIMDQVHVQQEQNDNHREEEGEESKTTMMEPAVLPVVTFSSDDKKLEDDDLSMVGASSHSQSRFQASSHSLAMTNASGHSAFSYGAVERGSGDFEDDDDEDDDDDDDRSMTLSQAFNAGPNASSLSFHKSVPAIPSFKTKQAKLSSSMDELDMYHHKDPNHHPTNNNNNNNVGGLLRQPSATDTATTASANNQTRTSMTSGKAAAAAQATITTTTTKPLDDQERMAYWEAIEAAAIIDEMQETLVTTDYLEPAVLHRQVGDHAVAFALEHDHGSVEHNVAEQNQASSSSSSKNKKKKKKKKRTSNPVKKLFSKLLKGTSVSNMGYDHSNENVPNERPRRRRSDSDKPVAVNVVVPTDDEADIDVDDVPKQRTSSLTGA